MWFTVSKGCDTETGTKTSNATPLHCAVWMHEAETVRLLADRAANLESKDKDGATPMRYAISRHSPEMIDLLISLGAESTDPNYPSNWTLPKELDLGVDPDQDVLSPEQQD